MKCSTLQDVIDHGLSIRPHTHETYVETIINLCNDGFGSKYHAAQIAQALQNINSKGTDQLNKIIEQDDKFWSIIRSLYKTPIIKNLFDDEYAKQVISKCKFSVNEWESLLWLYIRSSQKPEIRSLIDFALQNPDIINDVNIDTIQSINGEIITQNVLYEWNLQYQRFTQDPTTKIYNYIDSIEKTPFETAEQALSDMIKNK